MQPPNVEARAAGLQSVMSLVASVLEETAAAQRMLTASLRTALLDPLDRLLSDDVGEVARLHSALQKQRRIFEHDLDRLLDTRRAGA